MGKPTGFLEYGRENLKKQAVEDRTQHWGEFEEGITPRRLHTQAARCMDCGVPFCNFGCPVQNLIPEFNEYIYADQWRAAYGTLQSTNNFPEFTGRVCPAPCESACCAGLVVDPVAIKLVEKTIIERAFEEGWVKSNLGGQKSGVKIAVIGSGPSGLAAAVQLNLAGHEVTVFEKNEVLGGLLALGIPDFKLEKHIIERRIEIMRQSGIEFKTQAQVGRNLPTQEVLDSFAYLCLCGGAERPNDLPNRPPNLAGIHQAMDFLSQQNRRVGGRAVGEAEILAKGKHVIVLGGGDTGADCVGTSIRQGAKSVTQIEILPKPPLNRTEDNPWPEYPRTFKVASSHEEGCSRLFSTKTAEFIGLEKVEKVSCIEVNWEKDSEGKWQVSDKPGTEFELQADLVLLAIGFAGPIQEGLIADLGLEFDSRGNVQTHNHQTSHERVFAAGDMATGQSLVVRAIYSGRSMAKAVDTAIKGHSHLS